MRSRAYRRSYFVLVGGGLAAVVLVWLWLGRASMPGSAPRIPVVYAGSGSQTTAPFPLAGGTYHTLWSAWEKAPEYPPCTHSAELMAVDPANAALPDGHLMDLARFAHVPATGGTDENYIVNVK